MQGCRCRALCLWICRFTVESRLHVKAHLAFRDRPAGSFVDSIEVENRDWTGMNIDVRDWLESLGLGEYAAAFEENYIDGQVLAHLTADDLKEIGIAAVGHRRRLLEAITNLAQEDRANKPPANVFNDTSSITQHDGERRQVTVLFADICGFTKLSSSTDSEEVHKLLAIYFEHADKIIRDCGGTVDKHVGDSVMAVFGAPISHGNDADRAVRAAIEIQEAMLDISGQVGRPLQVHIGIASGEVVASGVGPDSHYTVIGDSVNLAARLTDKAQAGEIFVSSVVRSSVEHSIATNDLGEIVVKGLASPVRVYSVKGSETSADLRTKRPFVGRVAEVRQFTMALEICKDTQQGQIIQIRGDAGIGKTRLTSEFCTLASESGFRCHRTLILDFGVGKGQDPVRMLVRSLLDLPSVDDMEERSAAAHRALAQGVVPAENELHLNDLLDLPQSLENIAIYDAMDNLTRNAGKLETVVALIRNMSTLCPRLLVFEDLHWADKLVLQQIAKLGKGVVDAPVIIVLTSRIEGDPLDPAWRNLVAGTPFMTLDLGPLSPADAMGMAKNFVDTADGFARTCIERAAGNPLFLEQLLRSVEEAGELLVPGSVQSIVQARLDRLPASEKTVVQAASVLGQRFSLAALRHLIDDATYDCAKLVTHQLIQEQGEDYLFAHALVRDGVYRSLLRSRRNELHLVAANWFSKSDLPLRAEHLERAHHESAADAYLAAAQAQTKALRLENARGLAERGLKLADNHKTKFELNCMLGDLLRELGEPEQSIDAYQRALSEHADKVEKCVALLGVAEGMRIVERIDEALSLLDDAQPIAQAHELSETLMHIHHLRGNLLFPKGDIDGCEAGHRQSIEYAKKIGSAEGEARGLGGLGDAAYMAGRMRTSHEMLSKCVDLCREHGFGRTEVANAAQICQTKIYLLQLYEAIELGRATIEAARRVGHDRAELNAAAACLFAATELSDWSTADEYAAYVRTLGERLGSVRFSQEAIAFHSLSLKANGRSDEALSMINGAISAARELGLSFGGPRMLGHFVRIASDPEQQDRALAEAEAVIEGGCVGHNHPFFYRDAIEVMIGRGDWDEVNRYADALAKFAEGETLPWSNLYIARARGLAAMQRDGTKSETIADLNRIRDEARSLGLVSAIPAIESALSIE